jgi:hypothetical protein
MTTMDLLKRLYSDRTRYHGRRLIARMVEEGQLVARPSGRGQRLFLGTTSGGASLWSSVATEHPVPSKERSTFLCESSTLSTDPLRGQGGTVEHEGGPNGPSDATPDEDWTRPARQVFGEDLVDPEQVL